VQEGETKLKSAIGKIKRKRKKKKRSGGRLESRLIAGLKPGKRSRPRGKKSRQKPTSQERVPSHADCFNIRIQRAGKIRYFSRKKRENCKRGEGRAFRIKRAPRHVVLKCSGKIQKKKNKREETVDPGGSGKGVQRKKENLNATEETRGAAKAPAKTARNKKRGKEGGLHARTKGDPNRVLNMSQQKNNGYKERDDPAWNQGGKGCQEKRLD